VNGALEVLWHGLRDALLMAWEVWWALVLGFAISAIVQAWVPRARVQRALAGSGPRPVTVATGLGAASSSCSYAAVAIARSLFEKGASAATALAFQFASTNLVWELGLVLWVLLGWQFTLAEYLGGIVMIALMAVLLRAFVPARVEADAREHVRALAAGNSPASGVGNERVEGGIVRAGELRTEVVGAGPPTPLAPVGAPGHCDHLESWSEDPDGRHGAPDRDVEGHGEGADTGRRAGGSGDGASHDEGTDMGRRAGGRGDVEGHGEGADTGRRAGGSGDGAGHGDHARVDSPGGGRDPRGVYGRLRSRAAWSEVARTFRMDWRMLYREITIGFLLAGFIAQLGNGFFEGLFIHDAPAPLPAIESAIVGPLIAMLSFVCSVGNVPLAAVLWSGGIGFSGVLAFLFADLLVLPIIAIYRKYYGTAYTLRTVALMYCAIVLAALALAALSGALGLVPTGPRPSRADVFGTVGLDYKFFLNALAAVTFVVLYRLGTRPDRGVPAGV
jgi:uncharacterized membrane protein YraQ (UPF0718 family)